MRLQNMKWREVERLKKFKKMLSGLLTVSMVLSSLFMYIPVFADDEGGSGSGDVILEHGFEEGERHGWNGRGAASVVVSTEAAHSGSSSLKVTGATDNWHGAILGLTDKVNNEYTYEFQAYVRLDNEEDEPITMKLTLQYSDSNYQQLVSARVGADEWVELTGQFTIPETTENPNFIVEYVDSRDDNQYPAFFLDDVKITEVAKPVFDPVVVAAFDFEDGLQGWTARGGATVTQATYGYESDHSLFVEGRTSTWHGAIIDMKDTLKYGATYEVTAMVQLQREESDPEATGSTAMIKFQALEKGGNPEEDTDYIQVDEKVVPFGSWVGFKGTFTVDKLYEELFLYVETNNAADLIYLDDVVITQITKEAEPPEPTEPEEPEDPEPGDPPVPGDSTFILHTFEDGSDSGWRGRLENDFVEVSSEAARTGSQGLVVHAFGQYHGAILDEDFADQEEDSIYHVSVWVKMAPGEQTREISLSYEQRLVGADTTYHNIAGNISVSANNWVKLSGKFTIPENLEYLKIYIESMQTGDSVFYIDDFEVVYEPPIRIQYDIPSLKDVYADYFDIGAATEAYLLTKAHKELLFKHYNVLVAENSMKPESIQPNEGDFRWGNADALLELAKENGMKLRLHTALWHAQTAEWMFLDENNQPMAQETDPAKREANKQLVLERLEKHIQAIVERYGDYIDSWDVVNEVIADGGGMRTNSPWWQIFGDDTFIREAFRLVRKYHPEGKLYINDYGTHAPQKRDTLYQKVQEWLADGVPIDGVGHQTHIGYINPPVEQIIESIKMFGDLGLDNQITEMDVSIYNDDEEAFLDFSDIPPERYLAQAYRYKELFDALRKLEDNEEGKDYISQVVFWGIADDLTWLHNRGTVRKNAPFVFDHRLQAKDAYWAIVDPSKLPVIPKETSALYGSPEIDGERDLIWQRVAPEMIETFGNPEFASVYLLWDEEYIYVMVETEDLTAHVKDQIEVFVGDQKWTLKRDESPVSGVDYEIKEIEKGYRLEARIPLPDAGSSDKIAFDIRITDNSLDAPVSWSDHSNSQEEQPELLGKLVLSDERTKIYYAPVGTPDIDGEIDEVWSLAETAHTDVWVIGNSGATAEVKVLWDSEHLYVLADVTDPLLSDAASAAHEQDSIEIFLDQNHERTTYYQGDDGQYRVNFRNVQTYNGRASADNFITAARITEDGYLIEAAIKFDENVAVSHRALGFDLQVNDDANGDGTRDSVSIWNDRSGDSWQNTANYGILVLYDPDTEPVPEPGVERPIEDDRGSGSDPIYDGPGSTPSDDDDEDTDDPSATDDEVEAEQGKIRVIPGNNREEDERITIDEHAIRSALDGMESDTLAIEVAGEGHGVTAVDIPVQPILDAGVGVNRIDVTMNGVQISIAVDPSSGILSSGSETLTISVEPVTPNELPTLVREITRGFPVYQFGLEVDGQRVDQFTGHGTVWVSMDYTLQPGQQAHQLIVIYIGDDGKLAVIRNSRYDVEDGTLTFSPEHFSIYAGAYNPVSFQDMDQAAWATEIVEALASRDVVRGIGDGKFAPNRHTTRAEFIQMLMHALNLVERDLVSSFTDVSPGSWYYDAVASAEKLGVAKGRGDGTFGVGDWITREEMAVLTYRAALVAGFSLEGSRLGWFSDEDEISSFARQAVHQLYRAGVIDGVGDGRYAPKGYTTRAAAAAILYKLLGLGG